MQARECQLVNMPLRDGVLSGNALKQWRYATLSSSAACFAAAKRCQDAGMCRTPSSHRASEDINVHPLDAASDKALSRKLICVAWKQNVRHWIGKRCCRTAYKECNFLLIVFLKEDGKDSSLAPREKPDVEYVEKHVGEL